MAILSIRDVLAFYDGAVVAERAHSSAINALLGEELGIGLLTHCLRSRTLGEVTVLDEPCTQGKKKGVRLDRWVRVAEHGGAAVLYQVEVKNWCAHSLDGRSLSVDASADEVRAHALATWGRYWDPAECRPIEKPLQKVLVQMQAPLRLVADRIEPVACVWDLLSPDGRPTPWFSVPVTTKPSPLHWFSMSAYLRSLLSQQQSEVELEMPQLEARLAVVGRMVPVVRQGGAS